MQIVCFEFLFVALQVKSLENWQQRSLRSDASEGLARCSILLLVVKLMSLELIWTHACCQPKAHPWEAYGVLSTLDFHLILDMISAVSADCKYCCYIYVAMYIHAREAASCCKSPYSILFGGSGSCPCWCPTLVASVPTSSTSAEHMHVHCDQGVSFKPIESLESRMLDK